MNKLTKILAVSVLLVSILIVGAIILQKLPTEQPPVSHEASFEVSNLVLNSTTVEAGKAIEISVTVKNVGDQEGSSTVTLKIDGVVESSQDVTLAAQETKLIHFAVIKTEAKTYIASVGELVKSFQVTVPSPEPIILEGIGQQATNSFTLERGISIFHMTHDGHSNFAIWLYDAGTGERVDLLVNEIGTYTGSRIVGVTAELGQASPGEHLLDVTADGNWQVIIEQPRTVTAPKIPQTFSGRGDSVPSPFTLEQGTVKFEMTHNGNSNFAIWLYDNEGSRVDLLVNEIGAFEGSKIVGVTGLLGQASAGIHYLDITADGNWSVVITSV
jgi:hypothetical protein